MADETTIDLATLRFDGERFRGRALDVECTQERMAYRILAPESARNGAQFDESTPPIWEQLVSIGASAVPGTWDEVPTDLSKRIDQFVYGRTGV